MKKQIIILVSLFIMFVFGIVLFFIYQTRKIEKEIEKKGVMPAKEKIGEVLIKQPRQLIPANPKDYGMIVIDDSNRPQAQEEWDTLFSKKIGQLKSEIAPQTQKKVEEQIKEGPQKTQEKLKQIGENINKCKEILKDNPDNQEIKDKLERLMILKSIAKELP